MSPLPQQTNIDARNSVTPTNWKTVPTPCVKARGGAGVAPGSGAGVGSGGGAAGCIRVVAGVYSRARGFPIQRTGPGAVDGVGVTNCRSYNARRSAGAAIRFSPG